MPSSSVAATSSFSQVSAHSMGFCSASSTSSPFDGPVVVDQVGFLQSTLRAGGPYLYSLPAGTITTASHYDPETVYQIEGYAAQVLRNLQLQYQRIRLVGRYSKIDHGPEQVTTVLVTMPNQSQPALWRRAAREINQPLQRHGHDEISVELIETETDLFNESVVRLLSRTTPSSLGGRTSRRRSLPVAPTRMTGLAWTVSGMEPTPVGGPIQ